MHYVYNNESETYNATLSDENGNPFKSEEPLHGLKECEKKNINITHPSCYLPFKYLLEVPPGKYPLISVRAFTATLQFCV